MTDDEANASVAADRDPAPVIEVEGLQFGYRRQRILDDIDLTIYERDFLALIGPNGGGKTTLVKILLGLLEPTAGSIRSHLSMRSGSLGYVPQYATFEIDFPLLASEVVLMGRLGRRGLFRRYTAEDRDAVHRVLRQLHLDDVANQPITDLSGGQVQRVLIARALVSDPEILFLDEPTASIDAESRETLRDLLLDLNQRIPIVIVTHDLSSLPNTVKNVACLNGELFYHPSAEVPRETLERIYGCDVDLIAHGHPHRVLSDHGHPHG